MRKKIFQIYSILLLFIIYVNLCAFAAGEDSGGVRLPIIMYHSILKDPKAHGDYVVSPEVLEEDFRYLSEQGYTAITMRQLVDYVHFGGDLPEKPVMITFDDGYLNNILYAQPLLEKYDMCAVISIIGEFTDRFSETPDPNPNYAHLSWDEIGQAAESGRFEIGNHSFGMHFNDRRRGSMIKKGETPEQYSKVFTSDIMKLQSCLEEKSGCEPLVYTYPFGMICEESEQLVKDMGFKASFSCRKLVNTITRDPDCLFLLGRFNRPSGISTWEFMQAIK